MVKKLGIGTNVIIVILFVYYGEITAEIENIDFWKRNREVVDTRMAQAWIKPIPTVNKTGRGPKLEVEEDHIQFTKALQEDFHHSSPKYVSKSGRPHIGPILRIDDSSSDFDYNMHENYNRHNKQNKDKVHKTDENHDTNKKYQNDRVYKNHHMNTDHDQIHKKDEHQNKNKKMGNNNDHQKEKLKKIYMENKNNKVKNHSKIHEHKNKYHYKDNNHGKNKNHQRAGNRGIETNSNMDDIDRDNDKYLKRIKDQNKNKDHKKVSKASDIQKVKDHKEMQHKKDIYDENKDKKHKKKHKYKINNEDTNYDSSHPQRDHGTQNNADKKHDQNNDIHHKKGKALKKNKDVIKDKDLKTNKGLKNYDDRVNKDRKNDMYHKKNNVAKKDKDNIMVLDYDHDKDPKKNMVHKRHKYGSMDMYHDNDKNHMENKVDTKDKYDDTNMHHDNDKHHRENEVHTKDTYGNTDMQHDNDKYHKQNKVHTKDKYGNMVVHHDNDKHHKDNKVYTKNKYGNTDMHHDNDKHPKYNKVHTKDKYGNTDVHHDNDKHHKENKIHKKDKYGNMDMYHENDKNYINNKESKAHQSKKNGNMDLHHDKIKYNNENTFQKEDKHSNTDNNYKKDKEHSINKKQQTKHKQIKDLQEKELQKYYIDMKKHVDKKYIKKQEYITKNKDHYKVTKHDREKSDHGILKFPRNVQKIDEGNYYMEKYIFNNKVKGIRLGGPMNLPVPKLLRQKPTRSKILPENHYRPRIRTHKILDNGEIRFIQSTRMPPMFKYLRQHVGSNDCKMKSLLVDNDDEGSFFLSPFKIRSQIQNILDEFLNVNATIETLGHTVEYNEIIIAKIRHSPNRFRAEENKYVNEEPEKKIIFIVHGLSVMGMQWPDALSTIYGMRIILYYYLAYLDKFDIFFMPMANPDGYNALQSRILWNKNMSPQDTCPGVAVDRNFEVAWNASQQISSCSQLYPGPFPFSEVESKVIRDVFRNYGHKILAYIHVHGGTHSGKVFKGDAILYPRGYSESQSDDDKYIDLKGEIEEVMQNATFQVLSVTVDTLYNWYGKVTGTSVDYASTVYGIPYAMEFVMQKYDDNDEDGLPMDSHAMKEIWGRLISTTFNFLWKSLHVNNGVNRKLSDYVHISRPQL